MIYKNIKSGNSASIIDGKIVPRPIEEQQVITEFQDVLLKKDYYKERIIKRLATYGEIISDKSIQEKIDDIDLYMAIFKHQKVKSKDLLDTKKLNESFSSIRNDLVILYKLIENLQTVRYEETKEFIETHLKEAEKEMNAYVNRINLEVASSKLGKNIFFSEGPFEWFTKDNFSYVSLGDVELEEGSTIAAIINGDSVNSDNVLIGYEREERINYIVPYNYEQDTHKIQGEKEFKEYYFKQDDGIINSSSLAIEAEGLSASNDFEYITHAGEGLIQGDTVIRRSDNQSFYVKANEDITFYIKGGTYAEFAFTDLPDYKSFSGLSIYEMKESQQVRISHSKSFAFDIATDGKVFAEREYCRVEKDKVIYPKSTECNDFLVTEHREGKKVKVHLFIRTRGDSAYYPDIDMVSIKKVGEDDILNDII